MLNRLKFFFGNSLLNHSSDMLLIAGLGNPTTQYENTRHNAGFLVVDVLHEQYGGSEWKRHRDSKSLVSEICLGSKKVLLIKPQTYMNRSGQSVGYFQRFYKIDTNNILIIHDDIDLPAQRLKLKKGGSSGGQNGIKNIIAKLGSQDFWRLKCGIGRPAHPKVSVHDRVLGTMQGEELHYRQDSVLEFDDKIQERLRNK